MSKITFTEEGWADYLYWQAQDKKTLKRINQLLQDISRNGNEGIGKPEPLRENLSGFWSRRIDGGNRLVYRISGADGAQIEVVACRTHYGDGMTEMKNQGTYLRAFALGVGSLVCFRQDRTMAQNTAVVRCAGKTKARKFVRCSPPKMREKRIKIRNHTFDYDAAICRNVFLFFF